MDHDYQLVRERERRIIVAQNICIYVDLIFHDLNAVGELKD